jgi:hypothetical protein
VNEDEKIKEMQRNVVNIKFKREGTSAVKNLVLHERDLSYDTQNLIIN